MESNNEDSMISPTENSMSSPPSRKRQKISEIETFAAQCIDCENWRIIETKKKYEEIRSRILEEAFTCEKVCEWKSDVTCGDPSDISQDDGIKLWAIDKPNIPESPEGWERFVKIRSQGSTQFADVEYRPPTGRKLRSLNEVISYLKDHPAKGVDSSQFSFEAPAPLRKDYVIKRSQKSQTGVSHTGFLQPEQGQTIDGTAASAHEDSGDNNEDQHQGVQSEELPDEPTTEADSPPPALDV